MFILSRLYNYLINLFNTRIKHIIYKKYKDCKIYKLNNDFNYPELEYIQNKDNIGIALPGGGLRACCYSYGVLRGLHNLNILQKTRYIASVSGSSWLTSVYCYQKICNDSEFLGKYIPPEELTLDKLQTIENENEFTNVLHNNNFYINLIESYIKSEFILNNENNNIDAWSLNLSNFLYKKYNLDNYKTLPSLTLLNKESPYLIIKGCVSCDHIILPIEFTPLYYGIPINNNIIKASGIYTEPEDYLYLDSINNNKLQIPNDFNDFNVLSIMKTAGISSNIIPDQIQMNSTIYNTLNLPYMKSYNQELQLIDGGADEDYCGLLSLIKRNINTIILICPIHSTDDTTITLSKLLETNTSLSYYFGYPNNIHNIQVFEQKYWYILLFEFNKLMINKKPLVVKLNLNILPNQHYEIKGGANIDLILIHPSQSEWLDTLPNDTLQFINNDREKLDQQVSKLNMTNANFVNYPYLSYSHNNYSIELINAMSQNAAYDIITNKDKFL